MIHCFISEQDEEGESIRVADSVRERACLPPNADRGVLWQRRLNDQPARPLKPLSAPLLHTLRHLGLGFRLWRKTRTERSRGQEPVMDPYGGIGGVGGVPVGGMGAGVVGRSWTGDFEPGLIFPNRASTPSVVPANQFSIFIEPAGEISEATVLNPCMPPTDRLGAWDWSLVGEESYYCALFPRAWTIYEEPEPRLRVTSRQISPVIGHNYRETSMPQCVFVKTLENLSEEDEITVSVLFTWQNGIGGVSDTLGGHLNMAFNRPHPHREEGKISGVVMNHRLWQIDESGSKSCSNDPLSFVIAAASPDPDAQITCRSCWTTNSDGSEVWKTFKRNGLLEENWDELEKPSREGQSLGAAIAVRVTVPPGDYREIEFALAWDHPVVQFGAGRRYSRRYTHYYSEQGDSGIQLAVDALADYSHWEDLIGQWQGPVLTDDHLPGWYKSALFNELSLLSNGAIWLQDEQNKNSFSNKTQSPSLNDPDDGCEKDDPDDDESSIGKWACFESQECRVYNSYDALFYASFALIANWPLLELSLQKEIASAIMREDQRMVAILATGKQAQNKVRGAVPYDLGTPADDPWVLLNAYNIHDTSVWKDLNSKFVLSVYRDYVATLDKRFLARVWPAVEEALQRTLEKFDRNNDKMVENDGVPDQTYHTLIASGVSAYTGGLWIAALSAAAAIAQELQLPDAIVEQYSDLCQSAAHVYNTTLWNPSGYFNYDSSRSAQHDLIHADQLCGQWYARACGLPPIAPDKRITKALKMIFQNNVKKFHEGKRGALNGMRPDGRADHSCLHSSEAWPGTTFALASCMMGEGLVGQAFETACGACSSIYQGLGYWFRTPEAWDESGNFRSLSHIRSLAIWGLQWAWEQRKRAHENP